MGGNIHEVRLARNRNAVVFKDNRIAESQSAVNGGVGGQAEGPCVRDDHKKNVIPDRVCCRERSCCGSRVGVTRIGCSIGDHCRPPRRVREKLFLGGAFAQAGAPEDDVNIHGNVRSVNTLVGADQGIERGLRGGGHAGVKSDVDFETPGCREIPCLGNGRRIGLADGLAGDIRRHSANPRNARVRDVNVACAIHGQGARETMLSVRINCGAVPGCGDRAGGQSDLADTVVAGVRDIQTARRVDSHTQGVIQFGVGCQRSVAQTPGATGPRHGRDDTGGR